MTLAPPTSNFFFLKKLFLARNTKDNVEALYHVKWACWLSSSVATSEGLYTLQSGEALK